MATKALVDTALPQIIVNSSEISVLSRLSGSQIVAMMQPAKPWHRNDFIIRVGAFHGLTTRRRSLGERKMRSIIMVVTNVLVH